MSDRKMEWMLRGVNFAAYMVLIIVVLIIVGVIVVCVAGIYWFLQWLFGWT